MKGNRKLAVTGLVLALAVLCVAILAVISSRRTEPEENAPEAPPARKTVKRPASADGARTERAQTVPAAEASQGAESAPDEQPTEEERRAEEEERLVTAFDDLTDRWMEPAAKGVTMDDVAKFSKAFSQVPSARREECLQRALNLVPDENVMLLAGVLMDKSQPKEYAELVFNDILNRGEEVKLPILRQVYADKSHPCFADAAWILDVTGEKPK